MEEFIEQIGEMILESVPALAVVVKVSGAFAASSSFTRNGRIQE